jgi:hypothetical protein
MAQKAINQAMTKTHTANNYAFLSITSVPVAQTEHIRARWKGLSVRLILSLEAMVSCACGLLLNPAKVPNFQNRYMMVLYRSEIAWW